MIHRCTWCILQTLPGDAQTSTRSFSMPIQHKENLSKDSRLQECLGQAAIPTQTKFPVTLACCRTIKPPHTDRLVNLHPQPGGLNPQSSGERATTPLRQAAVVAVNVREHNLDRLGTGTAAIPVVPTMVHILKACTRTAITVAGIQGVCVAGNRSYR